MPLPKICPEGAVAFLTDVHPDEWMSKNDRSVDLFHSLCVNGIKGTWSMRANERTLYNNWKHGTNRRFTHANLGITAALAARNGRKKVYEATRVPIIKDATEGAAVIIEPHGNSDTVPFAYYSETASPVARGLVSHLGIQHVLYTSPHSLGYGRDNHVLVDLPPSWRERYLQDMRHLGALLADGFIPPTTSVQGYVYQGEVTVEQARRVGLMDEYPQFEPLPDRYDRRLVELGFPPGCVFHAWSYEQYGERTGYIGEVCLPVAI